MKMHHRFIAAITLSGLMLLSACAGATDPAPLQSAVATPTTVPGAATQTPIILSTATLGAPAPVAPTIAQPAPPAVEQPRVIVVTATSGKPPPPTATPLPSPTIDLTAVFAAPVTPNTKATSFAVILTITALAVPPTLPATRTMTPRVRRPPVIIGSGPQDRLPATSVPRSGGITVKTVSPQVSPGASAALSITTVPNTLCSLQVARSDSSGKVTFEPIDGSARQSAGRDGGIAWIWTVDSDEPTGQMKLVIDCGSAGVQQLDIPVLK
jgi:hypothetical protein